MTWGKMDDKFHRNPKVRSLRRMKGGREALGDWAFWWSWCLDDVSLTGEIPDAELAPNDRKSAKLLVSVGLWDEIPGGFRFHDFHEYNPTREQREAKKTADRDRVADKREASREDVASDSSASRKRVASTRVPVPSRPDPVPSVRESDAHAEHSAPVPTPLTGTERMELAFATPPDEARFQDSLVAAFERGWHSVTKKHLGIPARNERTRSAGLLVWARAVSPDDPVGAVERAARGAAADKDLKAMSMPWAAFCKQPGKYLPDQSVDDKVVAEIIRLASQSIRSANLASEALKRGDRDEYRRLNTESERHAQECERLKRGAA